MGERATIGKKATAIFLRKMESLQFNIRCNQLELRRIEERGEKWPGDAEETKDAVMRLSCALEHLEELSYVFGILYSQTKAAMERGYDRADAKYGVQREAVTA